jgi:hypothetical protein
VRTFLNFDGTGTRPDAAVQIGPDGDAPLSAWATARRRRQAHPSAGRSTTPAERPFSVKTIGASGLNFAPVADSYVSHRRDIAPRVEGGTLNHNRKHHRDGRALDAIRWTRPAEPPTFFDVFGARPCGDMAGRVLMLSALAFAALACSSSRAISGGCGIFGLAVTALWAIVVGRRVAAASARPVRCEPPSRAQSWCTCRTGFLLLVAAGLLARWAMRAWIGWRVSARRQPERCHGRIVG